MLQRKLQNLGFFTFIKIFRIYFSNLHKMIKGKNNAFHWNSTFRLAAAIKKKLLEKPHQSCNSNFLWFWKLVFTSCFNSMKYITTIHTMNSYTRHWVHFSTSWAILIMYSMVVCSTKQLILKSSNNIFSLSFSFYLYFTKIVSLPIFKWFHIPCPNYRCDAKNSMNWKKFAAVSHYEFILHLHRLLFEWQYTYVEQRVCHHNIFIFFFRCCLLLFIHNDETKLVKPVFYFVLKNIH